MFIKESADVVRLGPNVKGKVYFQKNGEGVLSENSVEVPEGWYAGALDGGGTGTPIGRSGSED